MSHQLKRHLSPKKFILPISSTPNPTKHHELNILIHDIAQVPRTPRMFIILMCHEPCTLLKVTNSTYHIYFSPLSKNIHYTNMWRTPYPAKSHELNIRCFIIAQVHQLKCRPPPSPRIFIMQICHELHTLLKITNSIKVTNSIKITNSTYDLWYRTGPANWMPAPSLFQNIHHANMSRTPYATQCHELYVWCVISHRSRQLKCRYSPKYSVVLWRYVCVAVCCSVLQCVAVCCSVMQSVAECCRVLQSVAECCRVLQSVAVCCSVLQCVAV